MRNLILWSLAVAGAFNCGAQPASPVILGVGNVIPLPVPVAPGQLLTLFVQPAGAISPASSYDISAVFSIGGSDKPMPVQQVVQASTGCAPPLGECPGALAVTVQVPFGIHVICPFCASPAIFIGTVAVSVNGVKTSSMAAQPIQDQVHFLTQCDVIIAGANSPRPLSILPCAPVITHSDGTMVSNILPAKAGEELVAYATGLGETNPTLTAGQPAAQVSRTVTTFNIDFNYRVNALATQPGAVGAPTASPLFTGATKGYVGLYQINFIVPPSPAGLEPCVNNAALPVPGSGPQPVQSNLTISVGSNFSFDGAGICVRPDA
jgi:uncharacterized protein (TIGR03437 family)